MVGIQPEIQSLWNPFRDWNSAVSNKPLICSRFKASETLLGIETRTQLSKRMGMVWFKASETLLGIETRGFWGDDENPSRFKASETLLGIETKRAMKWVLPLPLIQSLWNPFRDWNATSGESTDNEISIQSLWNPFRDWNLDDIGDHLFYRRFKASETLLGIETRRLLTITLSGVSWWIQSLWNPFRDWNSSL